MKLVSLRNKLRSIRLVWVTVVALQILVRMVINHINQLFLNSSWSHTTKFLLSWSSSVPEQFEDERVLPITYKDETTKSKQFHEKTLVTAQLK